jgi:3-oxoacyl-[acyl-carrier-protein] synthase II
MRRVVVTGLGAVTPLGTDAGSTWQGLLAGRSGIGYVTSFEASGFPGAIAGEVKGFRPEEAIGAKQLRHMSRASQFGTVAALEAVADARLGRGELSSGVGVAFGASLFGLGALSAPYATLESQGPRRISPYLLSSILPDSVSGHIAIAAGATGPNMAVLAASASGCSAIGEAAEVIRRGDAEVMIAGASEAPLAKLSYAAFAAMRATAAPGEDPSSACRPFDLNRSGFVVAEGAGAVILESAEHATTRGARVYCDLAGYGSSNDAFDMVAPEPSGRGLVQAITLALRRAGIAPERIGYVNAHGTASALNDRIETLALKRVFGDHAYRLAISSTKSMTGHLMGAAGAVEAVFSVLALCHGVAPPTMHYRDCDPECDLDYVPNEARRLPDLEAVLSNSVGLGGHNAALVFRRWPQG